jgi:ABC-type nitrate/sulfonate/bicarbonate transport system substrate-binding protein
MTAILTTPPQQTTKTKFSYTICPGVPTISALAAPLGLLHEEFTPDVDLDVTIKHIGFTGKTEWAHEDRFWIRNAGHTPAIWGRAKGVDSRIVALAWLEGTYPVVTLTGSGIRTVADLKGKRLGLFRAKDALFDLQYGGQLRTYTETLSTAGLTLNDVELVTVWKEKFDATVKRTKDTKKQAAIESAREIADRLNRGEFDAIALSQTAADVGAHTSIRVLYDVRHHPDFVARVHPGVLRSVLVSGPLLRERRDLVVRGLARLLQAADWAKAHTPAEVAAKLAEGYDVYPESLTSKYENVSEGIQIDLSENKIAALKSQKDFLLQHGEITKDFDVEPWVDHGPLKEAQALYADWKKSGKVK